MATPNTIAPKAVCRSRPNISANPAEPGDGRPSISEKLKERVDQQHTAVFQVQAIIRLAADCCNHWTEEGTGEDNSRALSIVFSLDAAAKMCEDIANELDLSFTNVIEECRT
jgi:hypothetical protein